MEINDRKSISDKLNKYDNFYSNNDDFIELTEWSNGEGIDININSTKSISLTYGELEAINYLKMSLEYES